MFSYVGAANSAAAAADSDAAQDLIDALWDQSKLRMQIEGMTFSSWCTEDEFSGGASASRSTTTLPAVGGLDDDDDADVSGASLMANQGLPTVPAGMSQLAVSPEKEKKALLPLPPSQPPSLKDSGSMGREGSNCLCRCSSSNNNSTTASGNASTPELYHKYDILWGIGDPLKVATLNLLFDNQDHSKTAMQLKEYIELLRPEVVDTVYEGTSKEVGRRDMKYKQLKFFSLPKHIVSEIQIYILSIGEGIERRALQKIIKQHRHQSCAGCGGDIVRPVCTLLGKRGTEEVCCQECTYV